MSQDSSEAGGEVVKFLAVNVKSSFFQILVKFFIYDTDLLPLHLGLTFNVIKMLYFLLELQTSVASSATLF